MKIVIVEDDPLQMEWLDGEIRKYFPKAVIERINTEHEFQSHLSDFVKNPPSIFVIDMLLRWTNPSRNMPPQTEEVEKGGFFRAGLRCAQKLVNRDNTKKVPIIIYTVLEKDEIALDLKEIQSARYLRKDGAADKLIKEIRSLTD